MRRPAAALPPGRAASVSLRLFFLNQVGCWFVRSNRELVHPARRSPPAYAGGSSAG